MSSPVVAGVSATGDSTLGVSGSVPRVSAFLTGVVSKHGTVSSEYIIGECERFFRSKYFHLLTKVDGEYLIQKIRREHEEKVRKEQVCTLS